MMNTGSENVKKPILVFPAGMPRSLAYLEKLMGDGAPVVGSSSLAFDLSRVRYPAWIYLPYVTDVGFDQALKQAIEQLDIGGIYTPNIVVWNHLSTVLKELAPHVALVNASPIDEVLAQYQTAQTQAKASLAASLSLSSAIPERPPLTELSVASLYRAPRRFVWNPTITMVDRSRGRWACGQGAKRLVHMSTGRH